MIKTCKTQDSLKVQDYKIDYKLETLIRIASPHKSLLFITFMFIYLLCLLYEVNNNN